MSELTRKELLNGQYRDKYGRLRNEHGKFVNEPYVFENDKTVEEIREWYEKLEKRELKKVNKYVYVFNEKIEPLLSDTQIEILCFIGVIFFAGVVWKVIECLLSLFV